jgi:hypothetical protein
MVPIFRKFAANSQLFNKNLRKSGAITPLLRPIYPKPDRLPGFTAFLHSGGSIGRKITPLFHSCTPIHPSPTGSWWMNFACHPL